MAPNGMDTVKDLKKNTVQPKKMFKKNIAHKLNICAAAHPSKHFPALVQLPRAAL